MCEVQSDCLSQFDYRVRAREACARAAAARVRWIAPRGWASRVPSPAYPRQTRRRYVSSPQALLAHLRCRLATLRLRRDAPTCNTGTAGRRGTAGRHAAPRRHYGPGKVGACPASKTRACRAPGGAWRRYGHYVGPFQPSIIGKSFQCWLQSIAIRKTFASFSTGLAGLRYISPW